MEYNKRLIIRIRKTTIMISSRRLMSALATILVIFLLSLVTVASTDNSTNTPTNTVHITYVSFVDPVLGFYKILDETTHQPSDYVSHILTINQGDTIIWKNDADTPNTALTIVSEQNLFPDATLNTNAAVFPYVFNQQGGKYTFHLSEHATSILTVMVRTTNTPIPTVNFPIPTPVATAIVPTKETPIPVPVATAIISKDTPIPVQATTKNTDSPVKFSIIQIISIIVVILSIYITYKTGKDKG